jgi:glycosyltransferase involved in cell wall biosynthesis
MNPLISIVTPTYNRKNELAITLNSVKGQSYQNWEHIIVDDGSCDGTVEMLQLAAATDRRIKVFRRKGNIKGPCTCRNEGVAQSRGEYVIYLDSDDILAPFCLEQRTRLMEEHFGLDFAAFPFLFFKEIPGDMGGAIGKLFITEEEDLCRMLKNDYPWSVTGPIWRRQALDKLGEWNTALMTGEDPEYHVRALLKEFKYQKVNEADWFCRINMGRNTLSSKVMEPAFMANRRALLFSLTALLKEHGRLMDIRHACNSMFLREVLLLSRNNQKRAGRELWREACGCRDLDIRRIEKWSGQILILAQGLGGLTKCLNMIFYYLSKKNYRHAIRPHKFREAPVKLNCRALDWARTLSREQWEVL